MLNCELSQRSIRATLRLETINLANKIDSTHSIGFYDSLLDNYTQSIQIGLQSFESAKVAIKRVARNSVLGGLI